MQKRKQNPIPKKNGTSQKRLCKKIGYKRGLLDRPTPSILESHPDKIKYWSFDLNESSPSEYNYGSSEIVWWICPADPKHQWSQSVRRFCARKTDCMFCSRRPVQLAFQLSNRFPDIAKEWHKTRNNYLTPENVSYHSTRSVWWQCPAKAKHQWCSAVDHRTKGDEGCPYCAQKSILMSKSLAKLAPDLTKFWDTKKNAGLSMNSVSPTISLSVYWKCNRDEEQHDTDEILKPHEFRERIDKIFLEGFRCSECNAKDPIEHPSLAIAHPALAKQWHRTKNGTLKPSSIVAGSSFQVWWQCPKATDHQWRTSVAQRALSGTGCPFCSKMEASSTNSLAVGYPELLGQWHKIKNKGVDPKKLPPSSHLKVWWKCPVAKDHEWSSTIYSRAIGRSNCPFCIGLRVSESNCLAKVKPSLAKEWHIKKNGRLTPRDVTANSCKKVFWQCSLFDDHAYLCAVRDRGTRNHGCPKCKAHRTAKEKSLKALFPKIAKQWHTEKNHPITPAMTNAYSNKKYWWICPTNDKHEFLSPVEKRTSAGTGCPICANRVITKENSLKALNPAIAKQWHKSKNGNITTTQVSPFSTKKAWWQCAVADDHVWYISPSQRTYHNSGCPFCSNYRFSKSQSFQSKYPEIAKQWNTKKNGTLKPDQVKPNYRTAVWWRCGSNKKHEWYELIPTYIKHGGECIVCRKEKL